MPWFSVSVDRPQIVTFADMTTETVTVEAESLGVLDGVAADEEEADTAACDVELCDGRAEVETDALAVVLAVLVTEAVADEVMATGVGLGESDAEAEGETLTVVD